MIPIVKKQHYVWEHYLTAWSNDGKIWCNRHGSLFNTSTENIAQERYFYEVYPLSQNEIELINKIIDRLPQLNRNVHHSAFISYLVASEGDEKIRRNGIEYFHSLIEGKTVKIINELRNGNLEIINDKQNRIDFSQFLGRQYTRTKKVREKNNCLPIDSNVVIPERFSSCDLKKVSSVLSFLFSDSIANWIYCTARIHLLENKTNLDLITGDQPIYNILSNNGEEVFKMELYYPISPSYALIISEKPPEKFFLEIEDVKNFNKHIRSISLEVVFSRTKDTLIDIDTI